MDLSQLVHDMLPLLRREFEDHRVRVRVDLVEPVPVVEGRRVQLEQVIVNLLMNACEALALVDGPRQVAVTTRVVADRVEVVVSDNGPGLRPEVADRLFEPFVSTKPKGMGMGLAISRSITDAHRGRLTAEASPGGGLTVVMSLPGVTDTDGSDADGGRVGPGTASDYVRRPGRRPVAGISVRRSAFGVRQRAVDVQVDGLQPTAPAYTPAREPNQHADQQRRLRHLLHEHGHVLEERGVTRRILPRPTTGPACTCVPPPPSIASGVQRPGRRIAGLAGRPRQLSDSVASPSWAANVSNNERAGVSASSPNRPGRQAITCWAQGSGTSTAGDASQPRLAGGCPAIWKGAAPATDDTTDRRNATAAPRPHTCTTRMTATNSGNDDMEP